MKRFAACLLSLLAVAASAADLQLLTDNHPPLHFLQGNQLVGFGVDVVQALAEQTGDRIHLQQVPLLRALRMASDSADTAVFTVLRTDERDDRYQWVGPLLKVETALYAHDTIQPPVRSLREADHLGRITVPRKWLAYSYLQQQGLNNLYGVETPEQMMRLFSLGRTDFVVSDTLSSSTLAREQGMAPERLQYQMPLMTQDTYIAFSRQTDPRQVARWQQALDSLRADGRLEQMRQRWLGDTLPR
ncbi:transporter substrate-binding domain-containing protein [Pseudomonas sp. B2M1-30]|uniref:Transporter substrate-binding domain-containing protein n=1 Tax=Pseudomonas koreensis TaxID=198620 RepID=A0A9X2XJD3_9PSED|nr:MULTISPECIES: transporter substrate-binding domain-containing protein [Pseudomonas]MCU0119991.1 transporter substrate-binding domain-containing protein [Pseudomonas sp. B2M1-30]MCU7249748.1 transporter substrate-binding domain-containing protein [Pseudomonas koreensis]MCU7262002.1 transporter substrate-binding domain-containing protein [Pseudomonas koreensis]